jgi:hypothetical protein
MDAGRELDCDGETNGNESSWADFLRCDRRFDVTAKQFCTGVRQAVADQGGVLSSFGTTWLKY